MAANNYIRWPTHRKKAAEQRRRRLRGVSLADLRVSDAPKPNKAERAEIR